MQKPEFSIEVIEHSDAPDEVAARVIVHLTGDWRIMALSGVADKLKYALKPYHAVTIESANLKSIDTGGALLLRRVIKDRFLRQPFEGQDDFASLFSLVGEHSEPVNTFQAKSETILNRFLWPIVMVIDRVGQLSLAFFKQFMDQTIFIGRVVTLCLRLLFNPTRLRWAPMVNVMQRAGIEAIPIIAMTNFFVGGVVAFLGVITLQELGGLGIFAVEMSSLSILREFAPMITAVFLAGRSASSFAAEIGTMKMRQEIDAMKVMGIDPYEALVVPKVLALVFMTPILTFIGAMAGLLGAAIAVWSVINFGLPFFAERMLDYVPPENYVVGMIKTPFFAATVALVGCRMGMTVKTDVVSLGKQVTAAVVQATFLIFMLDAIFAIIFRGLQF